MQPLRPIPSVCNFPFLGVTCQVLSNGLSDVAATACPIGKTQCAQGLLVFVIRFQQFELLSFFSRHCKVNGVSERLSSVTARRWSWAIAATSRSPVASSTLVSFGETPRRIRSDVGRRGQCDM